MPKEVFEALPSNAVKAVVKPGRHADGCGLYLHVSETGAKWWVWRGLVHGKRREIGMGSARLLPLAEARRIAIEWRRIARAGGDPKEERDKDKRKPLTFEEAARRVFAEQIEPDSRNAKHRWQWITTMENHAFPVIGQRLLLLVDQTDVKQVLLPIWTEKPETARRVRQRLRTVFDWARVAGLRDPHSINPVEGVEKGLPKQRAKVQHFRALPYQDLPELMARLDRVEGMGVLALRFVILTAARSGEVRGATWDEIDLEGAVWTVPEGRMKAGEEHRVPLSAPALALLEPLRAVSDGLIFPSKKPGKMLSDMTLAAVLKRLDVPVTPHGFRSTFRDWAEEATDYPHAVKEAALAHKVQNKVERAYRRSDLFEKRRAMMDEWAAFCIGGKDD